MRCQPYALKNKGMSKQIYKPRPVSGFPEWLPEVRMAEQKWLDHIRNVFESYGFCSIETPAVEELEVIQAKGGETDKEIYVLERLHKIEGDKEARLALHFDQTVPLARYVAQHFNDLIFPFKRYQIQKVWRGERPQAGRFREFYQCDIDVINVDHLPLHFDAEMPAIIWEILSSLPGMEKENIQLRVSNRKILIGLCQTLGIENVTEVTHIIDKIEKIGKEQTEKELYSLCGDNASLLSEFAEIRVFTSGELKEELDKHFMRHSREGGNPDKTSVQTDKWTPAYAGVTEGNKLLEQGIEELSFVMDQLSHLPEGAVVADLSIVRGLDYYTGTVYETVFTDDPGYGSICSGGRYDDLAGSYINKSLPGVGISIGFSRLFERLHKQDKLPVSACSPADILMVLPNEEQRNLAAETARTLRSRGYNVELYHAPQKLKKQLSYAERKGIPYVWFPPFEEGQSHEVKNMAAGEQKPADPKEWTKDD